MRCSSTVDVDHLPGDVGGVVEQEAHRARDVLRAARALEQRVVDDVVARRAVEACIVGPQDRAGCDGIDAHFRRQFDGQCAGQPEESGLGGAIQGKSGERAFGVDVRDVDDGAVRGLQMWCRGLREKKRRLEVAADQVVPGSRVDRRERRREEAGGVIDQRVEAPEAGQCKV